MRRLRQATFAFAALTSLTGCGEPDFTDAQVKVIASLSLASLPPLPADPSNNVADDP